MKKRTYTQPHETPLEERGIHTIRAIANYARDIDRFQNYPVKLSDGDQISIPGHVAEALLMVRNTLKKPHNVRKMDSMTILELLNIYTQAVLEGVIRPPTIKRYVTPDAPTNQLPN